MKKRLTVLFIIDVLMREGGTEVHLFNLVTGLDPERFRPVIVPLLPPQSPMIDKMRAHGIIVHPITIWRLYNPSSLYKAIQLVGLIRRYNVDIVQTYHFTSDMWGGVTARLAKVPVIISNRRDKGFNERAIHRFARRLTKPVFDLDICVSNDLRTQLLAEEKNDPSRIVTLYNGVQHIPALSPERRHAKLEELGLDKNRPIVGSVMNFRPVKGAKYLIEAAALVLNKHPEVQFVIVGGDALRPDVANPFKEELREIIAHLNLDGSLHFLGNRSDVNELLPVFDLFVLPSLSEGFSNALIESMHAGNCIIATAVGGNPEAIDHGINGLLVPPGDEQAIARALLDMIDHPPVARRLGEQARAKAANCFTIDHMIHEYESLYQQLYQEA